MISQLSNYMPSDAYHDGPRSLASAAFAPALVSLTITLTVAFMASIVTTAVTVSAAAAPVIIAAALAVIIAAALAVTHAVIHAVTTNAAGTAEGADSPPYNRHIPNPRGCLFCYAGRRERAGLRCGLQQAE